MQDSIKTQQLTEYRTLSNGLSGCLFYVGPNVNDNNEFSHTPCVYFLDSPCREDDKEPFINELHAQEWKLLAEARPLLFGYSACLTLEKLLNPLNEPSSLEEYTQWLSETGGEDYWTASGYKCYIEAQESNSLMEELIGKHPWKKILQTLREELDKFETQRYSNPSYLTESGELDYTKALLDSHWEVGNPICPIMIDNADLGLVRDKNVPMTIPWEAVLKNCSESKDGDREQQLEDAIKKYEAENVPYTAYGFIVALFNLARNVAVHNYAMRTRDKQSHPLDLRIQNLSFRFNTSTKTLCETYLQQVEEAYRLEEEQNSDILQANEQSVYIRILRDEREYEQMFFNTSGFASLLSQEQLSNLQRYCTSFQQFLINKIGYDPDKQSTQLEQAKTPVKKKSPKPFEPELITFTKLKTAVYNMVALYQNLIKMKWIEDGNPDDFMALFSGRISDSKVVWSGKVGKDNLYALFDMMVTNQFIKVPDGHSMQRIVESHFVDKSGNYVVGINSGKPSQKALQMIEELHKILLAQQTFDE